MATKLKNFPYNKGTKAFGIIVIGISFALFMYAMINLFIIPDLVSTDSFYQTNNFRNSYGRLVNNITEMTLETTEEVLLDGSVNTSVDEVNDEAEETYTSNRIKDIEYNISRGSSFVYVFSNLKTGMIQTNLTNENPLEVISHMPTCVVFQADSIDYIGSSLMNANSDNRPEYNFPLLYRSDTQSKLEAINEKSNGNWQLFTAVMDPIRSDDGFFYEDYSHYNKIRTNDNEAILVAMAIISGILILLSIVYLTIVSGKNHKEDLPHLNAYDEIPQEVQLVISSMSLAPLLMYLSNIYDFAIPSNYQMALLIGLSEIIVLGGLLQYMSLVRLIKSRLLLKKTLIYKTAKWVYDLLELPKLNRGHKVKITIGFAILFIINAIGLLMLVETLLGLIFILVVDVLFLRKLFIALDDLTYLMDIVGKRRNGDLQRIDIDRLKPMTRSFGEDLEALQDGLEIALNEAIKGEKLKTELITNVTHDLKNPLTSIISYVALLKQKEITDAERHQYISVLDDKSNRLKSLIEQLVDAAKATSGNVNVAKEDVDFKQLLLQLMGEYADELEARNLKCILPENRVSYMVHSDPIILYRIIENLMSNVSKYALENTRVYMDLTQSEGTTTFILKNISKDSLNIPVAHLSQRFVRGDASRHAEGSGLGLSIASSLAIIIGAQLELHIDGDLFKAKLCIVNK